MMRAITTCGGIGLLRPAPGTWASVAALLVGIALHELGGVILLLIATLIATFGGYWAILQEIGTRDEDPSEIVIDEVAGQWIALLPVSLGAAMSGSAILSLYPGLIVAFIAFRAFDILKPGPVGWADAQHGAFGIMADDIIAGWMAALVVAITAFIFHLGVV